MTSVDDENRLHEILEMIGRIAALDFKHPLETSGKNDMIDALAVGLNMLSEELNANVVEKSELDQVNQKLEKFAYTIAHDLKSPLNTLSGLLQLLELTLRAQRGGEVDVYIGQLKKTIEQMKTLVHGVLDYSRSGASHVVREEIDLNNLVDDLIETYKFESKQIEFHRVHQLPRAFFNRIALTQVIRNIIDNAIKYCDKKICEITISSSYNNGTYEIAIRDNGPGILPENRSMIFELFNSIDTEARVSSHGIGLATAKRLLNQEGESIRVEAADPCGSVFVFTLQENNTVMV